MGGIKKTYGAVGRGDLLMFDPADLKVITDSSHPQYDPRVELPIDEAMVASIMELGILEPLLISRDGEKVYVTDGRQRRANAIEANKRLKKAGLPPVQAPCMWHRGDDTRLFEISIAANEVRRGDSALARAKKMQRLAAFGRDEKQIAVVFGCTVATVKGSLALLECAPQVQRAVESGVIGATAATKLSQLPRAEQKEALEEMVAAGATKGVSADRAVRAKKEKRGIEVVARMRSRAFIERFVAELKSCAGTDADTARSILGFVLGADHALDSIDPGVTNAARRAAQKGKSNGKEESESTVGVSRGRKAEEKTGTEGEKVTSPDANGHTVEA